MQVSADQLTGKLRAAHDALPEGERGVYLQALGSPSFTAERIAWSLRQMGLPPSACPSPSLVRTFRREVRHEANHV